MVSKCGRQAGQGPGRVRVGGLCMGAGPLGLCRPAGLLFGPLGPEVGFLIRPMGIGLG